MVLTRINLKLIKSDFWLDFILFHFFKEIIKKFFLYCILSALLKKFWRYDPWKIQKNRKMLKKRHYLQQQLESHFWPEKRWNLDFSISIKVIGNWILLQKTSIPNQLEFWAANYGQNTKQVQKITQIQQYLQFSLKISNGNQHQICPSLSNRLILSLCFRRMIFEK